LELSIAMTNPQSDPATDRPHLSTPGEP